MSLNKTNLVEGFKSEVPVYAALLCNLVLSLQFIHLIGSAAWNVAGVILVAHGQQPLGPTASIVVAVVLLLLGLGLWVGFRRLRPLYIVISLLLGVGALMAFIQPIAGEASNWPSAFWRWSGATLNFAGLLANITGIGVAFIKKDLFIGK